MEVFAKYKSGLGRNGIDKFHRISRFKTPISRTASWKKEEYRRIGFQSLLFNAEFVQDTFWSISDFSMKAHPVSSLFFPSVKWFKWQSILYPVRTDTNGSNYILLKYYPANYRLIEKLRLWRSRKASPGKYSTWIFQPVKICTPHWLVSLKVIHKKLIKDAEDLFAPIKLYSIVSLTGVKLEHRTRTQSSVKLTSPVLTRNFNVFLSARCRRHTNSNCQCFIG